jgi:hypothetical protein
MIQLPLILNDPPELSDEAASQLLDLLYTLTSAFESHYFDQLRRHYRPKDAQSGTDTFDDDLPDF